MQAKSLIIIVRLLTTNVPSRYIVWHRDVNVKSKPQGAAVTLDTLGNQR